MITKIQFSIIILVVCLSAASCCKEKDKYIEVPFEFVIPISFLPSTDTVSVGQTLSLQANFSDSLYDYISQKKYYLPSFDFKTVAVIQKLTNPLASITEQSGATSKFQYSHLKGNLNNFSVRFADVNYVYQHGRYNLEVQIKAQESGVYSIYLYHSTGSKGQTDLPTSIAPSEVGIRRFPIMRVIRYNFNDGNTHFNIYKNNCKPADPNEQTNWVESKSSYTFVVK